MLLELEKIKNPLFSTGVIYLGSRDKDMFACNTLDSYILGMVGATYDLLNDNVSNDSHGCLT